MTRAPRETTQLFGHDGAAQMLDRAWHSGRLHHAWLLTGPPGIGKATLAYRFARTVLAGTDPKAASHRIAAGSHSDLLLITRGLDEKRSRLRQEIVLDDVRPIGSLLHRTAAEGGWRVVIVDGAEHLNRNAANALLKLIEEPPPKAIILLVCSASGLLLPTIRSRCRSLLMAPLSDAIMDEVLADLLPDLTNDERRTLIELSGGAPGHALALAAEDGIALAALATDALSRHRQAPGLWCYEMADLVLRREYGFSAFFGLLSSVISTTIRRTVRDGGARAGSSLLSSRTAEAWAETCSALDRLRDETERLNLDKRQALLAGLSLLSGS